MTTPTESRTIRPNFWLRAIEVRKHELTREYRKSLGSTAREGISDEDYATTMATLEKMARNLGWSEDQQNERQQHGRPFGRGRGFGHGHPRQFGGHGMRGHGPQHPFADQAPAETPES
ncbi:hypothetical protein BH11ACT5_BH11ACT5_02810 [soil metagenome]